MHLICVQVFFKVVNFDFKLVVISLGNNQLVLCSIVNPPQNV